MTITCDCGKAYLPPHLPSVAMSKSWTRCLMILPTGRCASEMDTSGSNLGKAVRPDKLATQLSILSSAYCCAREHHVPISLAPKEVACPRTLTPATTQKSAVVDSYVVRQERDVICKTSSYVTPRTQRNQRVGFTAESADLLVGRPSASCRCATSCAVPTPPRLVA